MSAIPPIPPNGLPSPPPPDLGKPQHGFTVPAAPSRELGVAGPNAVGSPRAAELGSIERRVVDFIAEARSKGLEGDNLVAHVVQRELGTQFGSAATPEMCQAVVAQFRADPVLMGLFNRMTS